MPRISRSTEPFNTYVVDTTVYLDIVAPGPGGQANYVRLGVPVALRDEWVARHDEWVAFYPTYTNPVTRTKPVTAQKNNLMKDFIEFAQPVLNIIAASPEIVEDDFAAFNIKEPDTEPSSRPAITTFPYSELVGIGGGMVRQTNRVQNDESRASMQVDADSIEQRYQVGSTPPASAEEAPDKRVYKGALRTFGYGQENASEILYSFFRWKNESDDSKSGPWSTLVQTVIS